MLTMLTISILLAVLYVGTAVWRRWRDTDASASFSARLNAALPDSISALVYELPRPWQWLWIVWIWSVSLLACIPLTGAMPDDWRILAFAALAEMICAVTVCGSLLVRLAEIY